MEFEGRARIRTQLDVTPLIDVVFLLLIFFLLTSTYITRESIELNLPSSDTAVARDDAPVVVTDAAREVLRSGILIDGHNDLPWQIRSLASSSFDIMDIALPQDKLQTDIPRLRRGGLGGQFIPAKAFGLDYALIAMFICLLVYQLGGNLGRLQ